MNESGVSASSLVMALTMREAMRKELRKSGSAMEAAIALVRRVEKRVGSRMVAYWWTASRVGRSSRWMQGVCSGAIECNNEKINDAINALLMEELLNEAKYWEADLALARQRGDRPGSVEILEAETMLAKIKALMRGQVGE